MTFKIKVRDLATEFSVVVEAREGVGYVQNFKFGWEGGNFNFCGQQYSLRGPHHGLEEFELYRMEPVKAEVEATREVPATRKPPASEPSRS